MSAGSLISRPCFSTASSEPASWAKKRSAGEFLPSSTSVAASAGLSPKRVRTSVPDASSYCLIAGLTIGAMRPLYIVIALSPSDDDDPQAASATISAASAAIAASWRLTIIISSRVVRRGVAADPVRAA